VRLRTKTLRPGYRLYHGTNAEFADAEIQGPAFFSEKPRVARWFVNWHGESDPVPYGQKLGAHARVVTYRVTTPLRLLLIPDKPTFDEITSEVLAESTTWKPWRIGSSAKATMAGSFPTTIGRKAARTS
jgi:hypothetical protein